jgi:hypothetical protein
MDCSSGFNQDCFVPVESVSVVEYEWRSLEKVSQVKQFQLSPRDDISIYTKELSLEQDNKAKRDDTSICSKDVSLEQRNKTTGDDTSIYTKDLSLEQQNKTTGVLSEWDDEQKYLNNVNTVGAPYRTSSSTNSVTCISFLDLKSIPTIWQAVCSLRLKVDEDFSGRYEWMNDDSLHCTIRALDKLRGQII